MLSTQKIVGKINTAYDIKTAARNADGRNYVVVHSMIVAVSKWFWLNDVRGGGISIV
jgi:hypothetical protein